MRDTLTFKEKLASIHFAGRPAAPKTTVTDDRGSHITEHADGRVDAVVVPEQIRLGYLR